MTKIVAVQGQQKWDYSSLTRINEPTFMAELKMLGHEGWELVSVLHYKDMKGNMAWTALMKRPDLGEGPAPAAQVQQYATPAAVSSATSSARSTVPEPTGFDLSDADFEIKD
jgi:hypothetical protein